MWTAPVRYRYLDPVSLIFDRHRLGVSSVEGMKACISVPFIGATPCS